MIPELPPAPHEHQFIFLRQESVNVGYERNPHWEVSDVFFCAGCLTYQKVKVREEVSSRERFGREVVWQK